MSQVLVKALERLIEVYPKPLAGSTLTPSQKKQLDVFSRQTQSVRISPRGRGIVYHIENIDIVKTTLDHLIPNTSSLPDIPQRALNIAKTRNSKKGQAAHEVVYVLAKTIAHPQWQFGKSLTQQLQAATEALGVFALELGSEKNKNLNTVHSIWLVENQALFDRLDWLPINEPATIFWYRGQLHNKLIDWLAAPHRATKVYFFGDYDGVGLNNYRRLKEQLAEKAKFWFMPNWKTLLTRYGQNSLWNDTAREFKSFEQNGQRLLNQSPELQELVTEMKKQGLALEQEVVWLSDSF